MYLWEWYWDLARTRKRNPVNGNLEPITYQELYYWQQVMRIQLNETEIDLLLKMDRTLLNVVNEEKKRGN